jgi:DNA-binding transcriptional LysR family regulator
MFTLKQVEAFFWVARLGTLQRAADKLNITQSAVTKRLQEFEAASAAPLFDAAAKRTTLTVKGREILAQCERLLDSVGELEEAQHADQRIARVVRIGVTELVVLTWFPHFMREMRKAYPELTFQPDIDLSLSLRDKVLEGRLDLAILPEPDLPPTMAGVELGRAPFAWFCPPGRFAAGRTVPLHELCTSTVIQQSAKSVITVVTASLFEAIGADPVRMDGGNSSVALGGLVEAGIGVCCLPLALFVRQEAEGLMQRLATDPPVPAVRYSAVFLRHPHSALGYAAADIARRCCDFGVRVQRPRRR